MLGPLFRVELVTSSRRARYYLLRVLYAIVLLCILWGSYEMAMVGRASNLHQAANVAGHFFRGLAVAQMIVVMVLGPAIAAGTIAVERERRTIEYLMATDLTNFEIVVGKLIARALQVTGVLLVGLPILAISMLMGGVAPAELWQTGLLTLAVLILVVALSVAVSLPARRARDAVGRTYMWVLVLQTLPVAFTQIVGAAYFGRPVMPGWLWYTSPFFVLGQILTSGFTGQSGAEVALVGSAAYLTAAAALVGWTTLTFRSTLRRTLDAPVKKETRFDRKLRPRRPIGNYPICWKEAFLVPRRGWRGMFARMLELAIVLVVIVPVAIQLWFNSDSAYMGSSVGAWLALSRVGTFSFWGLIFVAIRGAGIITGEREKDTWTSLISTPLSGRDIVWQKIVGNVVACRRVAYYIAIVVVVVAIHSPLVVLATPFMALSLVVMALFASTVGVFASLYARSTVRAIVAACVCLVAVNSIANVLRILMLLTFSGGRSAAVFDMSGVSPSSNIYAPGMIVLQWQDQKKDWFASFHDVTIQGYLVGLVLYAGATLLLLLWMDRRFDKVCQRIAAQPARAN